MLAAPAVHAKELVAYYEASWASLPAATMILSLGDDGAAYRDVLHIETVGAPRWLIHFRAHIDAAGTFSADGKPTPAHYGLDYDLRRSRNQHVRVNFVARDGNLIAERTVDDSSSKPPLPEVYRRNIIDPLTAFAVIREHLLHHRVAARDRFTLPVFDDVRRFDIAVSVVSIDPIAKLIHLHLDLIAIAGFKDKKADNHDPEDAPRPIELTFRDDADMMPQRLEVAVGWLPLVIRFDHRCADAGHCDTPAR
ncbi:MAG TPA: DUF3108 domain-containing protein [Stellaceae bacterium]